MTLKPRSHELTGHHSKKEAKKMLKAIVDQTEIAPSIPWDHS